MLILFSINLAKLKIYLTSRSARYVFILEQREYIELIDRCDVLKYYLCAKISVAYNFRAGVAFLSST
jgi:hypothetical protein